MHAGVGHFVRCIVFTGEFTGKARSSGCSDFQMSQLWRQEKHFPSQTSLPHPLLLQLYKQRRTIVSANRGQREETCHFTMKPTTLWFTLWPITWVLIVKQHFTTSKASVWQIRPQYLKWLSKGVADLVRNHWLQEQDIIQTMPPTKAHMHTRRY